MQVFNFSAGPSALPDAVLEIAKEDLKSWGVTGSSIMEISHRSSTFTRMANRSVENLRTLLQIPSNYKILFMQGGATGQFSTIPLNLLQGKSNADYINTGIWSLKAIEEADRYCKVNIAADGSESDFEKIPDQEHWKLNPESAYVHYTSNETVNGIEYHWTPETGDVPLVADMSSQLLSRPVDVSKYGLIYASTQKNIGVSGITLVIIRDDLIGHAQKETPGFLDYQNISDSDSIYNTPPTLAWYLTNLVFEWMIQQGGVQEMEKINIIKAQKLYDVIDQSDFYKNNIDPSCRSRMNIPFTVGASDLDTQFLEDASKRKLIHLNGFRSAGGMRASLYNAVTENAVDELVTFMKDFEKNYG